MWRLEICAASIMQELIRAFDERWIRRGAATREFGGNLAQPGQFSAKLLNDELEHPDSFMEWMAYFLFYCTQCFLFTDKLGFQEFLSTPKLVEDRCRRGLPGKRHPGEKWRAIALIRPVLRKKPRA